MERVEYDNPDRIVFGPGERRRLGTTMVPTLVATGMEVKPPERGLQRRRPAQKFDECMSML